MPDPFVLAVVLTFVVLAAAVALTPTTPAEVVPVWADGLWGLLAFSMQMVLILVTGYALAASAPVAWAIGRLAALPRGAGSAAALVAAVAGGLGALNWGLGLIAGALLAREVGRSLHARGVRAHYPLLAAAGYVGLMVWHGGFSGSAPLSVSNAGDIARVMPEGLRFEPIPITRTILSPLNLVVTGGLLALSPAVMAMLAPSAERREGIETHAPHLIERRAEAPPSERGKGLVPRVLEDTPAVNWAVGAVIGVWAWLFYFAPVMRGEPSGLVGLGLNEVNLTMLMLGLLLHRSAASYLAAVEEAARGAAGIVIQFPLYGGIMAVMHESGLTAMLSRGIASVAGPETLPALTAIAAGVVNLFVPSGGGQWAVQGPIAIRSAMELGTPLERVVLAVAYGDQITNMLQPFWALPLLAVTGVKAREIVGYTCVLMIFASVWVVGCLLVL